VEHFLIVEDYAPVARAVARQISSSRRRGIIAETTEEARELVRELPVLTGAIVDVALPDGTGFDVVRWLRARDPRVPVLMMTGTVSPAIANRCQLLGCELVFKPASSANLRAFAERASWSRRLTSDELGRYTREFAETHRLTRREGEVLGLALAGLRRPEIALKLGVGENTVKMQIRSMLRKTGHPNLGVLILAMLRGAWLEAG
jgi:two-component system, NarL family, response regulator DesR